MIINYSRSRFFQSCRRYAYNWDLLRLSPHREADPLIIGGGFAEGSEKLSMTADPAAAKEQAERIMRARYAKSLILPEEQPDIERNIEWVKHAIEAWAAYYDKADFRVLWPEVSGCVALPGTEHHCWFCHNLIFPNVPFEQCPTLNDWKYYEPSDKPENRKPCHQPHFLSFRTDGVIEMYKHIWLLEQKTTSSTDRNMFWTKFQLDKQVRCYAYGIWKKTGILVDGVLINAIIKHNKQITVDGRKRYQLDPTNVGFEREPVILTKEDLLDFEREIIQTANDYEHAFRTGNIYKNTDSCTAWNRKCYYFDLCKRHNVQIDGEFKPREDDYVNKEYYNLLGLPYPNKEETSCQNVKDAEPNAIPENLTTKTSVPNV